MEVRLLRSPPRLAPLYARTAAALVPGAGRLPLVPGGGRDVPSLELCLAGVEADPGRLLAYERVCGFQHTRTLPPPFPHVMAFPLQMALMTDGRFPFGAIGLVHVANAITQHRPIGATEPVDLSVSAGGLRAHPKGRVFDIHTRVTAGDALVWESTSTMLRRGAGDPGAATGPQPDPPSRERERIGLPGDLGRRYAEASGDRNPIHMHALSARAFGFQRAIAHGMWTKARALAALQRRLEPALSVDVRFGRPIFLPGEVSLCWTKQGRQIALAVRDAARPGDVHLEGTVTA